VCFRTTFRNLNVQLYNTQLRQPPQKRCNRFYTWFQLLSQFILERNSERIIEIALYVCQSYCKDKSGTVIYDPQCTWRQMRFECVGRPEETRIEYWQTRSGLSRCTWLYAKRQKRKHLHAVTVTVIFIIIVIIITTPGSYAGRAGHSALLRSFISFFLLSFLRRLIS